MLLCVSMAASLPVNKQELGAGRDVPLSGISSKPRQSRTDARGGAKNEGPGDAAHKTWNMEKGKGIGGLDPGMEPALEEEFSW